jgi:diguanylate cyclase (GGDEF)-like protein
MKLRLSFRTRLVLSLGVTIAAVQLFNAGAQFQVVQRSVVQRTGMELVRAITIFETQLVEQSDRLGDAARILSLDYALREAIATDDMATATSALRNYSQRLGGARMLLVSRNGRVTIDSAGRLINQTFAFPALLKAAARQPSAGIAVLDQGPVQLAAVPVLAPVAVGWVVAATPLAEGEAMRLQALSPVRLDVSFLWKTDSGLAVAGSTISVDRQTGLSDTVSRLIENQPGQIDDWIPAVQVQSTIPVLDGSANVILLLRHGLDDALEAYDPLIYTLFGVILAGLLVGVGGGVLLARLVAKPLAALARAAGQIEQGQYDRLDLKTASGDDEIARTIAAFRNMAGAVADREREIRHQASHDATTGLINLLELERVLEQRISASSAEGSPLTLIRIVIGRLPEIRNTLGHAVADRLICSIADLIIREAGSDAVVARAGDAAFALVLSMTEDAALIVGDMLVSLFDTPVPVGDITIDVQARAGIAVSSTTASTARELIRQSDVAVYLAQTSDTKVRPYRREQDPHRAEDLSLMGELRVGIERGEFMLRYQPKVDLRSGEVVGVEALVRWTHPRHGFLPPDRFIPLAEETGSIRWLTRWAIQTAVAQQALWASQNLSVDVAVNVSARDLADPELPALLADILSQRQPGMGMITIEVTESSVMRDLDAGLAVLHRLSAAGARISVDDFGTGHSSLAYLQRLPVNELKIDRSFIRTLASSETDQTVVRTVINLGHALGLKVVAEGIEDPVVYALLAEWGCDLAQGYFMARPLPPTELAGVAEARHWLNAVSPVQSA